MEKKHIIDSDRLDYLLESLLEMVPIYFALFLTLFICLNMIKGLDEPIFTPTEVKEMEEYAHELRMEYIDAKVEYGKYIKLGFNKEYSQKAEEARSKANSIALKYNQYLRRIILNYVGRDDIPFSKEFLSELPFLE